MNLNNCTQEQIAFYKRGREEAGNEENEELTNMVEERDVTIADLRAQLAAANERAEKSNWNILYRILETYGRVIIGEAIIDDVLAYGVWKANWKLIADSASLIEALQAALTAAKEQDAH